MLLTGFRTIAAITEICRQGLAASGQTIFQYKYDRIMTVRKEEINNVGTNFWWKFTLLPQEFKILTCKLVSSLIITFVPDYCAGKFQWEKSELINNRNDFTFFRCFTNNSPQPNLISFGDLSVCVFWDPQL